MSPTSTFSPNSALFSSPGGIGPGRASSGTTQTPPLSLPPRCISHPAKMSTRPTCTSPQWRSSPTSCFRRFSLACADNSTPSYLGIRRLLPSPSHYSKFSSSAPVPSSSALATHHSCLIWLPTVATNSSTSLYLCYSLAWQAGLVLAVRGSAGSFSCIALAPMHSSCFEA